MIKSNKGEKRDEKYCVRLILSTIHRIPSVFLKIYLNKYPRFYVCHSCFIHFNVTYITSNVYLFLFNIHDQ